MSAQHTPGPWHLFSSQRTGRLEVNGENGLTVAEVVKFIPTYAAEGAANARLIAAAPELFRAVELFLAYDSGDEENGVALMLAYNEALTAAQVAYAKARGHD